MMDCGDGVGHVRLGGAAPVCNEGRDRYLLVLLSLDGDPSPRR